MARRSYFKEIDSLLSTWDEVWLSNIQLPQNISANWFNGNAFCIGSGGSLSLAKLWQCIHEYCDLGTAKTITPFEFNYTPTRPDVVVLISASGKNHDILQAFRDAISRQCRVVIFTSNQRSPLIRLSNQYKESAIVICPSIRIVKDGFLAVNSVIAIACLMAKVAKHLSRERILIDAPVKLALADHATTVNRTKIVSTDTFQIVSSEWGMPAGLDFEARLAESAISTCFLTDPRNFGHGRFLWLERHPSSTVVFFATTASAGYIKRYRKYIPEHIRCYSIDAPMDGLAGSIYCLTRSILLFGEIAHYKKIDPGKPAVPTWGRKLHRFYLGKKDLSHTSVARQVSSRFEYPALLQTFVGIVLDIDGTLLDTESRFDPIRKDICCELERLLDNGLKIGFATGRGMSAVELLKKQISKRFHNKIIIGLHNGVSVGRLSENIEAKCSYTWPLKPRIRRAIDSVKISNDIKIAEGPTQISVRSITPLQGQRFIKEINSELGNEVRFVKYVSSGHSLDILPIWISKLRVVEALTETRNDNILCIGDQGQVGGNDEELLNWQPSISVGKARPASDDCLWVGKNATRRESSGALFVLKYIIREDDKFRFKISKRFNLL